MTISGHTGRGIHLNELIMFTGPENRLDKNTRPQDLEGGK